MNSLSDSAVEIKFVFLYVWFVSKCGKYFCETSTPTLGKLSFSSMFLSCPSVKKKLQSSCDYPFEKIGSITFAEMFMALSVNPQYKFLIALSTGF